jgi:hypothetical protein
MRLQDGTHAFDGGGPSIPEGSGAVAHFSITPNVSLGLAASVASPRPSRIYPTWADL